MENVQLIDQCREEIEAEFVNIQQELDNTRARLIRDLDELNRELKAQIERANEEINANAYLEGYQPSSYLASLIWARSCQSSSDPIPAFVYRVKPDMEALTDLLGIAFRAPKSVLAHLNLGSECMELGQDIETRKDRDERLLEQYQKQENIYLNRIKSLETNGMEIENTLQAQIKERNEKLDRETTKICELQTVIVKQTEELTRKL